MALFRKRMSLYTENSIQIQIEICRGLAVLRNKLPIFLIICRGWIFFISLTYQRGLF